MATLSQSRICKMEDCAESHLAKSFCKKHYRRYRRGSIPKEGEVLREIRHRGKQSGASDFASRLLQLSNRISRKR